LSSHRSACARMAATGKPCECVLHARWKSECRTRPFHDDLTCARFEAKCEVRACWGLQHGRRRDRQQERYVQASHHEVCAPSPAVAQILRCHGNRRAEALRKGHCGARPMWIATCQVRGRRLAARPVWHLALSTGPPHARCHGRGRCGQRKRGLSHGMNSRVAASHFAPPNSDGRAAFRSMHGLHVWLRRWHQRPRP